MARWTPPILVFISLGIIVTPARAQTATYHLHKETSLISSTNKQLKTTGPDATQTALQTANLKNNSGNFAIPLAYFETQSGVPNLAGVIPLGSVVTFTLRMKETNTPSVGSIYPHAVLRLNSASGQEVCRAGGQDGSVGPLTTTLTWFTFSCTTGSVVSMTSADRLFLEVDVWIAGIMGNHNIFGELDVETNADSTLTIPTPIPNITSLSVTSGFVGDAVTITGLGFGTSGTVTFNGTPAATSTWNGTTIQTSVPASVLPGAGPVVVTVNGRSSGGVTFTAMPHIVSVTPAVPALGQGVTIAGTTFGSSPGTITFNTIAATPTNWSDSSITTTVPADSATGPVVVTAAGTASNSFALTVITDGAMSGSVTRATGGAAVPGATVQAVLAGIVKGSVTSAGDGAYSIPNLHAGTYDVRVSAAGLSNEVRTGTVVTANATTTLNIAMSAPGAISGRVTQTDGTTPIVGAAVRVYSGPLLKGSASTNANGDYEIASLHTGGYTVQASSVGYQTQEQGATVIETATATSNFALATAVAGSVLYAYDVLGRLIQVTDPTGAAAIYRYDAVGNITAIDRAGTTTVAISGFTPASAAVGATVRITGTGFSATPGQNTVTFNGTPATVTAASATELTASVPAGATTGGIEATTPNGSAISSADFTVTAAALGPPTISGFTPAIVQAGSALTVNGTNFETNVSLDRLGVNVTYLSPTSATATALNTTIPAAAGSGKIRVATPNGTTISGADLFVAPAGYTATQVDATGRLTIGSAQGVSIGTGSHIGLSLFEGAPGQRISVVFTPGTITSGTGVLYDPAGNRIKWTPLSFGGGTRFIEPEVLPMTGTYTVLTAPTSTPPANTDVTVYTVPPDLGGTIAPTQPGTQVTASLQTPGQNALYTIGTPTNGRVDLAIGSGPSGLITVRNANGTTVASSSIMPLATFIEPWTFTSGQTISVDPGGAGTGDIVLMLYDVPPDLSGAITPTQTGAQVTAPLQTPGQNASYTIGTPTNTRVSLGAGAGPTGSIVVKNAAGGTVTSGSMTILGTFIEPWTFASGQSIFVDPSGTGTGTVTVTAYDVPPDTTGTVSIGGSAATVANQSAGQNGTLTFTVTASQQVTVHVANSSHGTLAVRLLGTDGQTVLSSATSIFANFDLPTVTLGPGTYTIAVDPQGASIGHADISVTSP